VKAIYDDLSVALSNPEPPLPPPTDRPLCTDVDHPILSRCVAEVDVVVVDRRVVLQLWNVLSSFALAEVELTAVVGVTTTTTPKLTTVRQPVEQLVGDRAGEDRRTESACGYAVGAMKSDT